jgi:hypothetical protein
LADKKPQAAALVHMIEEAAKQKGNTVKLDVNILKAIENDIGTVAKDFGEVAGAIWFAKRQKAEGVSFPAASNEKLVDYAIIKGGIRQKVSAKSGQGATPSIDVLPEILEDLKGSEFAKSLTAGEKKAARVLTEIANLPTVEANIRSNDILNTKPWKIIQQVTKGASTATEFENWISQFSPEEVVEKLTPFWEAVDANKKQGPKTATSIEKVFKKILNSRGKKSGIITVPLGFHASRVMNEIPAFNSVLNKALQTVTVIQVFLDMTSASMAFTVAPFATGVFEFKHNGQTASPSNRGFSFKMKKGPISGTAELPSK